MVLSSEECENKLFINNEHTPSRSSERLKLVNPWDDSSLTDDVHVAGPEDIDAAVTSAKAALKKGPYAKWTGAQRAAAMHRFADLVEKNADKLARLESLPTGRPVSMIKGFDVPNLVATFRYYAGWADKIHGKTMSEDNGTYKIVRYEPVGVCAGIASWNATFLYVGWKIAPALAAGCTFIFKPSEKSPLGVLAMAILFREAGFPPGVVQFVAGARETGRLLASHMDINKISFTGSIPAGKAVQDAATKSNLKRVTLEMGGKSPAIVFNDASMEAAIGGVGPGFLLNSGQICSASSRVLVQEDIAEKFSGALKQAFEQASGSLGSDPLEPTTAYGPLVDKTQFDRVMSYISIGKDTAQLLTGGERKGEKGCAVEPTLFMNPKDGSKIWSEEIFGPVLSIKTFRTEEEAIEMANATTYGLASSIYTSDLNRALRVSSALETGGVAVNTLWIPEIQTPFGGWKQSGQGRELGEEGLKAYLEPKSIHINMNLPPKL